MELTSLFALYGRHGESPLPVVAAKSPSNAFYAAYEAARIALKYMTPVILLSDNYVATGSEPWQLPDTETLNKLDTNIITKLNLVMWLLLPPPPYTKRHRHKY